MPDAVSTSVTVGPVGAAGAVAAAGSSAATATPNAAELSVIAKASNRFPCSVIRFNFLLQCKECGTPGSARLLEARWRTARHRAYAEALLHSFPVKGDIQALALLFLGDAQADRHVDDFQDDEAHHEAVDQRGSNAPELSDYRSICAADFLAGEDARQQRADDAANAVHAESVERVVITERVFQGSGSEETQHAGSNTDDHRRCGTDK